MREAEPKTQSSEDRYSNPAYRIYVLLILTLVYVFNFLDRQLVVILQEPIKLEMGLSDTQLGLLSGLAFAAVYVIFGLPLAQLAERWNRRSVISASLAVWSGMTALTGFVSTYTQLLMARAAVGIGEAGGSPPAHSILSDIFPLSRRATALAFYSTGINIGILLGFLLGGWMNEFFGWRMAFVTLGLPGIVLAVIVRLTVMEPRKGVSEGLQTVDRTPAFLETWIALFRKPAFRHLALATGLQSLVGYGIINWLPSFMIRTHGMSTGELGTWLALSAGISGAIGTFTGGVIADRLGKKDLRFYLLVPALSLALVIPLVYMVLSMNEPRTAMLINIVPAFLQTMFLGPAIAMTHALVGVRAKAVGSAILFFILNLVGLGLGPLSIGVVSDYLEPGYGTQSIGIALISVITVAGGWAVLHYALAARTLRADIDTAD
jgi:predicted MFS family arabinose efflux permease